MSEKYLSVFTYTLTVGNIFILKGKIKTPILLNFDKANLALEAK